MAIKIIKFDLPINGTKVTTLEALRDNLTDEIVPLARSGQLERWFKSRQMQEQVQAVANAFSRNKKDKELFLALCAVLEVEVHPDDASAIFDAPPQAIPLHTSPRRAELPGVAGTLDKDGYLLQAQP